ncbi:MAG: DUF502 domain-containing protein [Chitinivibrionales bacterium]|nr:DUF502 domain-containing protein [Chitinivibrionales bacterium]
MNRLFRQIASNIISGTFVVLPAVATIYLALKVFVWVDSALPKVLHGIFPSLPERWPWFLGIIVTLVLAYFTGLAAKNYFGKKIIEIGNGVIANIPLINKIYLLIQQIVDVVAGQKNKVFDKAILLQYPKEGSYCIGFVTSYTGGEIRNKVGTELVSVFVPTTPNPTSGFLLYIPTSDIIELDMNVETAIKAVMSAGVLSAEDIKGTQHLYAVPKTLKNFNWLKNLRRNRKSDFPHDPRD